MPRGSKQVSTLFQKTINNMDNNDKKSKRPRIGENRGANQLTGDNAQNLSAGDYNATPDHQSNAEYSQRSYQPRQGSYQPRRQPGQGYNNRYNNNGGGHYGGNSRYNNDYQPRPHRDYNNAGHEDGAENSQPLENQGSYQPRQGGYNQHSYQPRQGGYNQRSYQPRQGGYNNNRPYQPRQAGGYNNNRQGQQDRQGSYQPRQAGGYNNNRQGGYNNNRQGSYQPRQGGYNNNRQGGYNSRQGSRPGMMPRQNRFGMPQGGKSFTPRPKRIEYDPIVTDPDEQIRLNKFMANAGVCSRREADEFIQQGLVKVNGEVVTELGTKIKHSDVVEYDDKVVTLQSKCYILLNKPKDCVTTSDDPNGRVTVMDIVKGACDERIYPVGRLDRNTTGVLLLTNDGDLASKLTHPKYVKKKIYHVWTDKDISEDDMQRIADGIELEDGPIHADAISYATETDRNQAGIEIHSGRNRIVRRIFESLGYHVTKLDRVYFAGLTKKNLPRGRWRYLTQDEVNFLKMGSFE